ncbi:MAG: L-threonylcarbamoyladenylate synthase [Candidatus Brocadiia bacterium]
MSVAEIIAVGTPGLLETVIAALEAGNLVILPTETVYGIAARADFPLATKRLANCKRRPEQNDFAHLISGLDDIRKFIPDPPPRAMIIARRFFPGPLTLVIEHDGRTMGFRCPAHPFPLLVARNARFPIVLTSANLSGHPPARDIGEVDASGLLVAPAVMVDGGRSRYGLSSTVVSVRGDIVRVVREGALPSTRIPFLTNE